MGNCCIGSCSCNSFACFLLHRKPSPTPKKAHERYVGKLVTEILIKHTLVTKGVVGK